MQGLSGDQLFIQEDSLIKVSRINLSRFVANTDKHLSFSNPHITSIPLSRIADDRIEMPLFRCKHPLRFLSDASSIEILEVIEIVENYLECIIRESQIKPFDYTPWLSKLSDLEQKITDEPIKESCHLLRSLVFQGNCYYGTNHGDLTLSNLFIIQDGKISIEVFDFLSSFIESPIQDLVKLRQDSKHLWSTKTNSLDIDACKVAIILDCLDQRLTAMISADPILSEYYLPFQLLNLIRIIPYNTDPSIHRYLSAEIEKLTHELHLNHSLRRTIEPL